MDINLNPACALENSSLEEPQITDDVYNSLALQKEVERKQQSNNSGNASEKHEKLELHSTKKRKQMDDQTYKNNLRKESHKIIEQKRRKKINEKINELKSLLNYPNIPQNKAVILESAVKTIKYLQTTCSTLTARMETLQQNYSTLSQEHEKLKKAFHAEMTTSSAMIPPKITSIPNFPSMVESSPIDPQEMFKYMQQSVQALVPNSPPSSSPQTSSLGATLMKDDSSVLLPSLSTSQMHQNTIETGDDHFPPTNPLL